MYLVNFKLLFGGVGVLGMGCYYGKYLFDIFIYEKSYIFKFIWLELGVYLLLYKGKFKYIKVFFKN